MLTLLIIETIVKTDVTINRYCSYILSASYCSYSSFHSLSPILSPHIFLTSIGLYYARTDIHK